jgi:hypothetical protein
MDCLATYINHRIDIANILNISMMHTDISLDVEEIFFTLPPKVS